ncbi:MAG: SH3 domain-containing protein [Anaerolineaceae bacterium]|nr:MAG: SH3 domain-containing protein [Anaerolineaceae bacterium]
MINRSRLARMMAGVLLGLAMVVLGTACTESEQPVMTQTPQASATAFPTANRDTATPAPTLPPLTEVARRPQTPPTTRTPPCDDAPPTRLVVGERGRVGAEDMRPLNIRADAGTDARIIGRLEVGDVVRIIDGPRCANGFVWYLMERIDGDGTGWIAEGEASFYYIEPYLIG